MTAARQSGAMAGHTYYKLLCAGKTAQQIASERGISHVAIVNGLARAGLPSITQIRATREKSMRELLESAVAAEQALRYKGSTLHADRLASAMRPFIELLGAP